jgi:hypothetical protein
MKNIGEFGTDEIVALCMSLAGITVLLGGLYSICILTCEISIEEILLIGNALLLPSTGYLFGKSVPKKEDNDIKELIMHNMHK